MISLTVHKFSRPLPVRRSFSEGGISGRPLAGRIGEIQTYLIYLNHDLFYPVNGYRENMSSDLTCERE